MGLAPGRRVLWMLTLRPPHMHCLRGEHFPRNVGGRRGGKTTLSYGGIYRMIKVGWQALNTAGRRWLWPIRVACCTYANQDPSLLLQASISLGRKGTEWEQREQTGGSETGRDIREQLVSARAHDRIMCMFVHCTKLA